MLIEKSFLLPYIAKVILAVNSVSGVSINVVISIVFQFMYISSYKGWILIPMWWDCIILMPADFCLYLATVHKNGWSNPSYFHLMFSQPIFTQCFPNQFSLNVFPTPSSLSKLLCYVVENIFVKLTNVTPCNYVCILIFVSIKLSYIHCIWLC